MTEQDRYYSQKRYLRAAYAACKRAQDTIKDLQEAANGFGILSDDLHLLHAQLSVACVRSHASAGVDAFVNAIEQAKECGYDCAAIVEAAGADRLHPLILADWLEDNGVALPRYASISLFWSSANDRSICNRSHVFSWRTLWHPRRMQRNFRSPERRSPHMAMVGSVYFE